MQMWLNRSMGIKTIIDGGIYEKPHFIYEHTTTKKLKLQTNSHDEISITLLNSFNGKQAVFWLTKKGRGPSPEVKASISNYSSIQTQSQICQLWITEKSKLFSEDAVIHKVMYSPNYYNFDSEQYHKIMIQEKLNGSYIL